MITLNTVEEAIACLVRLQHGEDVGKVEFAGELASVRIKIDGEKYHATVPGELARGIWLFQKEVYEAAAFALTGQSDIRKLTSEQRSDLELVFKVEEGSSDFWAALGGLFERLGDGFKNMDDAHKTRTLILIALIVAGGYGFGKGADVFRDIRKEQENTRATEIRETAQTEQMKVFADAIAQSKVAQKFDHAMTNGVRDIVRSAPDATEIKAGRTVIDAEDIQELNKRASRVTPTADVLDMQFRIFKVDVRDVGIAKYVLAGPGTGEFVATLNEADFTKVELVKILEAAQKREDIRLAVVVTRRHGEIRSGQIVQVL